MLDFQPPDLTFPMLAYGKDETPLDLRPLLYKGGAGTNAKLVSVRIDAGELGIPLENRIEVVQQMHEVFSDFLGRGGRPDTLRKNLERLRSFFRWADESCSSIDLKSVESSYLHWTDALIHRVRVGKGLSEATAYSYALSTGWVLDRVLQRKRPIIRMTRLKLPKRGQRAVSPKADKQNLEETFAFGHFLLDIADGLSVDAVWGPLPIRIPLRNGQVLEEWSALKRPETIKAPNPRYPASQAKYLARMMAQSREKYEEDRSLRTRYPLINLRITAEMFMFMGQPGVNLAQAHQLRMDQWKFKPSTHGYEVRTYKHRRWGPVAFEIYSEYKKVFKRYLEWRTAIFPNDPDGLLFPLIRHGRHIETAPGFTSLIRRCQRASVKYLPPSVLRNTNVNWMLRRTNDPDLTAEEKQHSKKTLINSYERPSLQRSMVQIKGYWAKHDPAQAAVGPGSCTGKAPDPIPDIPATATKPDCQTPAGCLFCAHQRDIDSLDHVWSLATYRLLKSFELASDRKLGSKQAQPKHPAELAIDRLTAKLAYIEDSNATRKSWVKEVLLRIEEGRYHPDWAGMIEDGQAGSYEIGA